MKLSLEPIVRKFNFLQGREFFRFAVVGSVGFCIDGGLLTLLTQSGWKIPTARMLSFISAVTVTWLFNRYWTFALDSRRSARTEYAGYIATQAAGAIVNLAVFFILIELYPSLERTPLIPLAFGAIVSLVFNYTVSKKYVFKG